MLSTRHARVWKAARRNFLLQALDARCQTSQVPFPSASSSFSSSSFSRDAPQASTSAPIQAPPLRIAIPIPKSTSQSEPAWMSKAYPTALPHTSGSHESTIFRYRSSKVRSADRTYSRLTFLGDHQAGLIANEIALHFLNTWDRGGQFKLGPLRSHLITNNHMACLAAQYKIPERSVTEDLTPPIHESRTYGKWMADTLEAYLGSLHDEQGQDAVRDFLAPIFYLELASRIGPYLPDFDFETVQKFKDQHATLPDRKAFWPALRIPNGLNAHIKGHVIKQEKQATRLAEQHTRQKAKEAKRKHKESMAAKSSQGQAPAGEPQPTSAPAAVAASETSEAPPAAVGVESIAKMLREAQEALQAHERNHFALHKQIHNLQREYSIQKRSAVSSTT